MKMKRFVTSFVALFMLAGCGAAGASDANQALAQSNQDAANAMAAAQQQAAQQQQNDAINANAQ